METIRLKLRRSLNTGFLVTLYYQNKEIEGFLPLPPKALQISFDSWQCAYRDLSAVRQQADFRLTPQKIEFGCSLTAVQDIKTHLNHWLNANSSGWQTIRDCLVQISARFQHQDTSIILDAKESELRHLPWQEWNLFEQYYPKAEVVLSAIKTTSATQATPHPKSRHARILVIVGQSDGINTTADLQVIQKLETAGAEVVALIQPSRQTLCEALWDDRGYHILIYTGHSSSDQTGKIGWIDLNGQERLSIEDFRDALKEVIGNGLQLAIFNSCDGLGLAYQLAELNLSQCIVMREPVPDSVAVDFFKYFFKEFTQNYSLLTAVRRARRQLEPFKSSYPGVIWLPILCLKLGTVPVTWSGINSRPKPRIPPLPPQPRLPDQSAIPFATPPSTQSGMSVQIPMQPLPLRSSSQGQALAQVFSLRANWYNPLLGLLLIGILGLGIGLGLDRLICQWNPTRCDRSPARFVESIPDSGVTTLKSVETLPGVWRYSGSTAWAAIRKTVDQAIRQAHPDFKLTYISHPTQPPGSGMGIQMVLNGQLSFAQSSRPLEDQEYKMAEQRGFQLKQIPVAIDGIVVVVHPDLAVKGLTLAQLTNIYTGKITNWGEVGGPDLPIVLYASPKGSGSPMFMQQNLFAPGETFSPNLIRINTPTEAINKIGRDRQSRGGIYMATATNLVGQCLVKPLPLSFQAGQEFVTPYLGTMASPTTCLEQPNQINHQAFRIGQYPLTRRLFVIIKQDSQLDQKAGEIYTELLLTDEGQRLIQESGFTPIRSPAAENSRFNSIKTIQIPELLLRSIIP